MEQKKNLFAPGAMADEPVSRLKSAGSTAAGAAAESPTAPTRPRRGSRSRPRGDGFSDERKRLFLVALRRGESVLGACALVGVSNRTVYNHRDRDPAFARDWALARGLAKLPAELAAYERGVVGIEEPVHTYGRLTHSRVRRSDALLKALLAAEHPEKYGRRAGAGVERQRLERLIDRRIAVALAPLIEALRAP